VKVVDRSRGRVTRERWDGRPAAAAFVDAGGHGVLSLVVAGRLVVVDESGPWRTHANGIRSSRVVVVVSERASTFNDVRRWWWWWWNKGRPRSPVVVEVRQGVSTFVDGGGGGEQTGVDIRRWWWWW
jgi:hypothetical protein